MKYLEIIGAIVTLAGSVFLFLGALGLLRMPDSLNRIQTGTKASTLGTILTLTGIIILEPSWFGKLIVLIVFVLITNPVSSHVMARTINFLQEKKDENNKYTVQEHTKKNIKQETEDL